MSRIQSFSGNVTNGSVNFGDGGENGTTLKTPVLSVIRVLKDGTVEVDGKAVCRLPTTGGVLIFEGDVQDVNLEVGVVKVLGNVYGSISVHKGSVEIFGERR